MSSPSPRSAVVFHPWSWRHGHTGDAGSPWAVSEPRLAQELLEHRANDLGIGAAVPAGLAEALQNHVLLLVEFDVHHALLVARALLGHQRSSLRAVSGCLAYQPPCGVSTVRSRRHLR